MALEGLCAAKAATRLTDDDRDRLRGIGTAMQEAVRSGDLLGYSELNRQLHALIRTLGGQSTAQTILERLRGQNVRHQFRLALHPGRAAVSLPQHLEIIEALCAGEAEAAEAAVRRHLHSVVETLPEVSTTRSREARRMRTVVVTDPPRADVDDAEALGELRRRHRARGAGPASGCLGPRLRPAWPGARIGGTAVTALCWPGDNLMIHVAVEQCRPGDVLVVTTTLAVDRRPVRRAVRHLAPGARRARRRHRARGPRRRRPARDGVPGLVAGGQRPGHGEGDRRRGERAGRAGRADSSAPATWWSPTTTASLLRAARRRRRGRSPRRQARVDKEAASARRLRRRRARARPLRPARAAAPTSASRTSTTRSTRRRRATVTDVPTTTHRRALHACMRGGTSRGLLLRAARPARRPGRPRRPAAAADGHARPAADRRPRRRPPADQQGRGGRPVRPTPTPTSTTCSCRSASTRRRSATGRTAATSWPASARSPSSAGWCPPATRRPACGSGWSTPTASPWPPSPTPGGRVEYRGDVGHRRRPGHRRAGRARVHRHRGLGDRQPAAHRRACATTSTASTVTCVDNGMPVVLAMADVVRADRRRVPERAGGRHRPCSNGSTPSGARPGELMGLGDVPRHHGAEDGAGRAAPRRRHRSCTRTVHPGAAAHRDRRAGAVSVGHRHAAARRGRRTAHRRLAAGAARGRRRAPDRPPAVDVVVDADGTPATGRPLGGRPHRPQALRRHSPSPAPDWTIRDDVRMPPLHDIAHVGHVELLTPDPDASLDFFTRYLGLTENGRGGDSVFLRAWDDYEHHHASSSPRTRRPASAAPTCAPPAREALERRVAADRGGPASASAGRTATRATGRPTSSRDPDGHEFGLYWESEWYQPPPTATRR